MSAMAYENINRVCKYCQSGSTSEYIPSLVCEKCNVKIHIKCLRSGGVPGGLDGDTFFTFICQECSLLGKEEISRKKLPWVNVLLLALYNLHLKGEGFSKRGYFHWKMHIYAYIIQHWGVFFGNNVKKKKNLSGTVAGAISTYSPRYFTSGNAELGQLGWWKLSEILPPELLLEKRSKLNAKEMPSASTSTSAQKLKIKEFAKCLVSGEVQDGSGMEEHGSTFSDKESVQSMSFHSTLNIDDSSLSTYDDGSIDFKPDFSMMAGCSDDMFSAHSWESSFQHGSLPASEYLFTDDDGPDVDMSIDIENVDPLDIRCQLGGLDDLNSLLPENKTSLLIDGKVMKTEDTNTGASCSFDDVSSTNETNGNSDYSEFCVDNYVTTELANSDRQVESPCDTEGEGTISGFSYFPSMFKSRERKDPTSVFAAKERDFKSESRCIPMSSYEEQLLLRILSKQAHALTLPAARRLHRKLMVRQQKRMHYIPLFNLDSYVNSEERNMKSRWNDSSKISYDDRVLDRFQRPKTDDVDDSISGSCPFYVRLMGSDPACFVSPYTERILKPFIRRDYETTPLWLKVMQELITKTHKNDPNFKLPKLAPIDYSYVRPQHIPIINSLCSEFFWPGVDLSECLQYPDFSCVVLYKRLIIGFAFLVPDVSYNETYISFFFIRPEWRRAGIGSFMLYHLIQTCMGKDVTLHVSATNPALILYQKFGFKVEEFVQDFYDKYFPADSKECKHALFLRLSR